MSAAQEEATTASGGVQDALIVLVPVVTMLMGSFATFASKPTQQTEARFQRVSAGLLLGAVILEIWPQTEERLGNPETRFGTNTIISGLVGFIVAVLLMYGLKSLELEAEDEDEEEEEHEGEKASKEADLEKGEQAAVADAPAAKQAVVAPLEGALPPPPVLLSPAPAADGAAHDEIVVDLQEAGEAAAEAEEPCKAHAPVEVETVKPTGKGQQQKPIPWSFVLAVVVDACVDGLLVGISAAISVKSGRLMAIASGIEMGFLGFSYGRAIIKAARNCFGVSLMMAPPLVMFAAALGASAAASSLSSSAAFTGVLAFALVALLFLVFEELITESGEAEGVDRWHIGGFLYFGILIAIILDQTL